MENFDEIDPELAVDYSEYINFDPSILYQNSKSVGQTVDEGDRMSDADIIAQLKENNKAENSLTAKKEGKEIQKKILSSAAKTMVHIEELRHFFEGRCNLGDYTVGKKSIRALEIFRVQKLILNATS